jgi:hypothetical protein
MDDDGPSSLSIAVSVLPVIRVAVSILPIVPVIITTWFGILVVLSLVVPIVIIIIGGSDRRHHDRARVHVHQKPQGYYPQKK